MTKKILTSVTITVLFALLGVTIFFMVFYNIQLMNKVKSDLKGVNEYIASYENTDKGSLEKLKINELKINNSNIRVTLIEASGKVIYDNSEKDLGNHLDRPEVKEAIENGSGYSVRKSDTIKQKLVYYATKLEDGRILRTSVNFQTVEFINGENIEYSIAIVLIILLISFSLSMRLVKTIVEPISDLERVTTRIAGGDLQIRVNPTTDDEIGSLGTTFNNMADQLQGKINEVLDKQSRLEAVLRSMESGVIAVNVKDEVIIVNPYAKRIFGIKKDIEGEEIAKYIKDYDINDLLNIEDETEKEIRLLHPVERELRVKATSIINGKDKIGKVIAVQDITDLKRLENMRSQFVANVSHELKTPLTSIKGFAETLKYVQDEETRIKFLDIIDKEAERLSRLINDILVLSKIESDVFGQNEEFLPNNIIEDVVSVATKLAESKNIRISVEQSNNSFLIGNKDKFLQLVLNLVENGIKYSNDGSYVKIKSYSANGNYILEVEDNGIGIPKEDISRIFERFYRVDKARKSGGTGLGLAIVKHIVKNFNGEIQIKSEINVGTCFKVIIRI